MDKVLILTEAGRGIGMGHLTRCMAIKDAFKTSDVAVEMWVHFIDMVVEDPTITSVDWVPMADLPARVEGYSHIIIDSYRAHKALYQSLASASLQLVVIDDYNRIGYAGDLILNPNVFYQDIDYSNQNISHIGGGDFVILREAFRASKPPAVNPQVESLLISIGGSDFRLLLPKLIEVFLNSGVQQIKVVAPEGLNGSPKHPALKILGRQSADQMVDLFRAADVVVSACGQSLHELASLGKPVIGICLDIDQEPNQSFYHEKGMLHQLIGWDDDTLGTSLISNLEYLTDFEVRLALSKLEPTLINEAGVYNIVQNLLTLSND